MGTAATRLLTRAASSSLVFGSPLMDELALPIGQRAQLLPRPAAVRSRVAALVCSPSQAHVKYAFRFLLL